MTLVIIAYNSVIIVAGFADVSEPEARLQVAALTARLSRLRALALRCGLGIRDAGARARPAPARRFESDGVPGPARLSHWVT